MAEKRELNQGNFKAALGEVNKAIQEKDDPRDFLKLILKQSIRQTGSDCGYLLLRNPDQTTYQVIAAQDSRGKSLAGDMDLASRKLLNLAMESSQVVQVDDGKNDRRLNGVAGDVRQAKSFLIVPMLLGSRGVGAICLSAQIAGHFNEEEQGFVSLLTTLTALVVEKARQAQIIRQLETSQSEFISLVTHQLRVPLTSVTGYSDMLLNGMVGPLPERQEAFLRTIRRNADRMSILIDRLGEMNRIDAGRRKFQVAPFDLTGVVETAIGDLHEDIDERRQELIIDVEPALPLVQADRSAVLAILVALVDNASRYSPDATIISIWISQSGDHIQVEIVDQGIGVATADQNRLFEPFFRSDDPTVRNHTGWGLALAHSKKVVEALGGTIGFKSSPSPGATFFFTLPVA